MIPVVTPAEMKAIDEAAQEPVEVLIGRAGGAVAEAALAMLGGTYGRRAVVVAGRDNNGADGRSAARRLQRRGVRVEVLDATQVPASLPPSDLVIDAAYGTGFRGEYQAPDPSGAPVLAVDIPSGVSGLTGQACADAVVADTTVSFAALKPGLLLGEGAERAGTLEVVDIGLDVSRARAFVVEQSDVAAWLPDRPRNAHKYLGAVWVVAGSPGMLGAALLCTGGAFRAGAGYVRLGSPGVEAVGLPPGEHVGRSLPRQGWDSHVLADLERFRALVVGPGLGRSQETADALRALVASAPIPVVVDGDGLWALGGVAEAAEVIRGRSTPTVLTPHDGEFARLAGSPPGPDRLGTVSDLSARTGAVVLSKGSTTVVADPGGDLLLATEGDARLATAGTGDVLSGVIGAFIVQGLPPLEAAAAGAVVHGAAAHLGFRRGLVASDLHHLLPVVLSALGET